jgi:hypothetical protein
MTVQHVVKSDSSDQNIRQMIGYKLHFNICKLFDKQTVLYFAIHLSFSNKQIYVIIFDILIVHRSACGYISKIVLRRIVNRHISSCIMI